MVDGSRHDASVARERWIATTHSCELPLLRGDGNGTWYLGYERLGLMKVGHN